MAECLQAAATTAELARQREMFERTKLDGLPSTYVGSYLVNGADDEMLRSAVAASIAGSGRSVRWMILLIAALFVFVTIVSLTRTREPPAPASAGDSTLRAEAPRCESSPDGA